MVLFTGLTVGGVAGVTVTAPLGVVTIVPVSDLVVVVPDLSTFAVVISVGINPTVVITELSGEIVALEIAPVFNS